MNLGKTAKAILGNVAPDLLKAFGGPFGAIAGTALHAVLGTNDDQSADAALAGATPELLAKVQQANLDFRKTMADLGVTEEKLAYADTADARAREIAVKDHTPTILAFLFVAGWFVIQGFIMTHVVDPAMRDIVLRTLGTMDMSLGLILGYYFGSSAGSRAKDATIQGISKAVAS